MTSQALLAVLLVTLQITAGICSCGGDEYQLSHFHHSSSKQEECKTHHEVSMHYHVPSSRAVKSLNVPTYATFEQPSVPVSIPITQPKMVYSVPSQPQIQQQIYQQQEQSENLQEQLQYQYVPKKPCVSVQATPQRPSYACNKNVPVPNQQQLLQQQLQQQLKQQMMQMVQSAVPAPCPSYKSKAQYLHQQEHQQQESCQTQVYYG
ncbi:bromodomain-containing protein DDB_G0280777-like [Aethina tumida]|uniref:bromodomain-containing protein DDB_G0280777-like n=1 Tax=Aethina tumida TaxID=116153 RepID=UPI002147BE21|nr:bromodomain-containing protein DDB_G0280777-like [Aethina tumida]